MKKTIKFEMKRSLQSLEFVIAVCIGMLIVMIDFILYAKRFAYEGSVVFQAWVGTDYQMPYGVMYGTLLPVLGALPFAGSYFLDLKSGYIKNICLKSSRKEYYVAKSISVFCSAALAVMIPYFVNLFLVMGLYPLRKPEKLLHNAIGVQYINVLSDAYALNPVLYIVFYIILDGAFAGMLAIFSVCISEWLESYFSVIVLPYIVVLLSGVIFPDAGKAGWSVYSMLLPGVPDAIPAVNYYIVLISGILIEIIWINHKGKGKNIL